MTNHGFVIDKCLLFIFNSHRVWSHHVTVTFAAKFKEYLCSELDTAVLASSAVRYLMMHSSILLYPSIQTWEKINITEEAEDGQKVLSVISVPAQVSFVNIF